MENKVFKNTSIPVLDINNEWKLFNPFDAILLIDDIKYKDILCIRFFDKDIFFNESKNKWIIDFFNEVVKENTAYFTTRKSWTNVPAFPNSYNRYKLNLKCITFDLSIYRFVHQFEHIEVNPQEELDKLGVVHQLAIKKGITTVFWNCQNIPKDLPEYFLVSQDSPNTQNCLFPVTQEIANEINNYML